MGVIVRLMLPFDWAIDEHTDDLAAQRYSAETREDYGGYLRKFADTVPHGRDVAKITPHRYAFRRRYVDRADTTQKHLLRPAWPFRAQGRLQDPPVLDGTPEGAVPQTPEDRGVLTVPAEDVRKLLAYRSSDWTQLTLRAPAASMRTRTCNPEAEKEGFEPSMEAFTPITP